MVKGGWFMKKLLIALLLILITNVSYSAESLIKTDNKVNGRYWRALIDSGKHAYVNGFIGGIELADEQVKNEEIDLWGSSNPKNFMKNKVIEFINEIYANPLNRVIPISDVLVIMKAARTSNTNEDEMINKFRLIYTK